MATGRSRLMSCEWRTRGATSRSGCRWFPAGSARLRTSQDPGTLSNVSTMRTSTQPDRCRKRRCTAASLRSTAHVTREDIAETHDDRRMAAACAAGDSLVFEKIYRDHGKRMKSIAFNHLGTAADAEDAVQETFLKIHRAAATYTGEASFSTWVYRILINTCYDLLRKRKRRGDEIGRSTTCRRPPSGRRRMSTT